MATIKALTDTQIELLRKDIICTFLSIHKITISGQQTVRLLHFCVTSATVIVLSIAMWLVRKSEASVSCFYKLDSIGCNLFL